MIRIKRVSNTSPFPLVPRGPIWLTEFEQEQRPSGNRDREAIVVEAGLRDGEGSVDTPDMHRIRWVKNKMWKRNSIQRNNI